jgi:acetyl esterase/lipase
MSDLFVIDHKPFCPEDVSKETYDFNRNLDKLLSKLPPQYTLSPQKIRDNIEAGKGLWKFKKLDVLEDRKVPAKTRDVPVRVYVPPKVNGVYLHLHGGGFMLGRAHHQDIRLIQIADHCDLAVMGVDYRLAPENPYPAGADDCEAVAIWLAENIKKEFGTDTLIIGGESAGANLSVVTLKRMRDKHGFTAFNGANLVYGIYDLAMTPSARNWGESPKYVLTTKLMKWFHENYAPADKINDPEVSPLYANLSNMPPALFTVGTLDPLLDDTLFMHARWISSGNEANLVVYPGGVHAFNIFPLKIAHQANKRIDEFLIKARTRTNHSSL